MCDYAWCVRACGHLQEVDGIVWCVRACRHLQVVFWCARACGHMQEVLCGTYVYVDICRRCVKL